MRTPRCGGRDGWDALVDPPVFDEFTQVIIPFSDPDHESGRFGVGTWFTMKMLSRVESLAARRSGNLIGRLVTG